MLLMATLPGCEGDGTQRASGEKAACHDLWIRNGLVHDGTGDPPAKADILIRGDRIERLLPSGTTTSGRVVCAHRTIDAAGKVVAPGFIDTHSHGDPLEDDSFASFALQGVTTVVLGQDGNTPGYASERGAEPTPPPYGRKSLEEWMQAVERTPLQTNIATLVGHGSLRLQAGVGIGTEPTAAQLAAMQAKLREGLNSGAWGMSSGLEYVPGRYSRTAELVALSDAVGEAGGVVMSHMRSEDSDKIVRAIDELIAQGRRTPVHASHIKVVFARSAAEGDRVIAHLDAARDRGIDITTDVYPYLAGYGDLSLLYPPWAKTREEWERAIANARPKLESWLRERIAMRGGGEAILLADAPYTGKTLAQVAQELGQPAEKVLIDAMGFGGPNAAHFIMRQDVQDRLLTWKYAAISTDGGPWVRHPRSWGTYPRILGNYVRKRHLLTMADAIRKMTGLPAAIVGLPRRGRIREGWYADLVVFDPGTVRSLSTWSRPAQAPSGIDYVIVNGCVEAANGRMTGHDCGKLLRKAQGSPSPSAMRPPEHDGQSANAR